MELIFLPENHIYNVDGEQIPSVSDLTRFISREIYKEVDQFTLDRAASRGTAVHKATEALDIYKRVQADNDIVPYVKAYAKFLKEHEVVWSDIEKILLHPDKLYAGTADRIGTIDGTPTLLDIKSTKQISSLHKVCYTAQLSLYQMCLETPLSLRILQLKDDESYKLIDIEFDPDLATSCIILDCKLKSKIKRRK